MYLRFSLVDGVGTPPGKGLHIHRLGFPSTVRRDKSQLTETLPIPRLTCCYVHVTTAKGHLCYFGIGLVCLGPPVMH